MRIVKNRLREMIPTVQCFLDVDDLEDIADLEGYIGRTQLVLIFLSEGCAYLRGSNPRHLCAR